METEKLPFWVFGHRVDFFSYVLYWVQPQLLMSGLLLAPQAHSPHNALYFTPWSLQPRTPVAGICNCHTRPASVSLQAYWSGFQFLLHLWDLGISLFCFLLELAIDLKEFLNILFSFPQNCIRGVSGSFSLLFCQKPHFLCGCVCIYVFIFIHMYVCVCISMYFLCTCIL